MSAGTMAANFRILEFLRKITENLRHQTQVQAAGLSSGSGHIRQKDLLGCNVGWQFSNEIPANKNQRNSEYEAVPTAHNP
jgi:hypothetical protein